MSDDIKFDPHNYRIHSERNKSLIEKSLKECGAGRSILIDADNEIIAGNGVYEAAKKANIKIKQVETDGSELVVVKRTDLKSGDKKRKKLAVFDNSTSDSSDFDMDLLQQDFEIPELNDFGVSLPDLNLDLEDGLGDDNNDELGTEKHLLKCPVCGHINEESAFKYNENEDT